MPAQWINPEHAHLVASIRQAEEWIALSDGSVTARPVRGFVVPPVENDAGEQSR